jgi:hypothetical protein
VIACQGPARKAGWLHWFRTRKGVQDDLEVEMETYKYGKEPVASTSCCVLPKWLFPLSELRKADGPIYQALTSADVDSEFDF